MAGGNREIDLKHHTPANIDPYEVLGREITNMLATRDPQGEWINMVFFTDQASVEYASEMYSSPAVTLVKKELRKFYDDNMLPLIQELIKAGYSLEYITTQMSQKLFLLMDDVFAADILKKWVNEEK